MSDAVVLLSGGLDSTTVATVAKRRDGHTVHALSFRYGQRHDAEIAAACAVAEDLGITDHSVLSLPVWGGSALTTNMDVPKDRPLDGMGDDIPVTYVPARNTVFLAFGVAFAEALGAEAIYAGMNALDYSGYPDCRPEYLDAFREVMRLGTKRGTEGERIRLLAPLIMLDKAEIIALGLSYRAPYQLTHSCYDPITIGGRVLACGRCDSCLLRLDGFARNGQKDPIPYAEGAPA